MIAMKFGGSSLAAAPEIERVAGIVRARLDRRPLVVVSAMAKTTRQLLETGEAAARGDLDGARQAARELRDFHVREGQAVAAASDRALLETLLDGHFGSHDHVLQEIALAGLVTPRLADAVVAFGELMSSAIFTFALRATGTDAEWLDCRSVLVTDEAFTRAQPLYEQTRERLHRLVAPVLARGAVPVLGGYVGSTLDGRTTTLGKEGSDFSVAIFGALLDAEEIQIWTDVDGILSADPRLFADAQRVAALSFGEALELAWSGSKKPHPGTLEPAERFGVPIRICSSIHPEGAEERGTWIGGNTNGEKGIRSIACRRNARVLRVRGLRADFRVEIEAAAARLRPGLLPLGVAEDGAIEFALDRDDRLAEVLAAMPADVRLEILPGRETISLISDDLAGSEKWIERALQAAAAWSPRVVVGASTAVRLLVNEGEVRDVVAQLHRDLLA